MKLIMGGSNSLGVKNHLGSEQYSCINSPVVVKLTLVFFTWRTLSSAHAMLLDII